jgi:hypothetical protein
MFKVNILKNHIIFVFSKESQNGYVLYFLKTLFLANNILKQKSSNNSYFIFTVTPCTSSPCLNNGQCLVYDATYICVCPKGYSGSECQGHL